MGMTMLESTYAQYLGQVHASSTVVRSTFILMGTFNIVSKLVTGNYMDKRESAPITFSLVGNSLMLLPFMSLGKNRIQCPQRVLQYLTQRGFFVSLCRDNQHWVHAKSTKSKDYSNDNLEF